MTEYITPGFPEDGIPPKRYASRVALCYNLVSPLLIYSSFNFFIEVSLTKVVGVGGNIQSHIDTFFFNKYTL